MGMHQISIRLLGFLFLNLALRRHFKDVAYSRVQRSLPGQDDTCNYFCPVESNMTEWLSPPKFEQPCTPNDIQHTYFTTQGNDHVVIKWTVPVATDRNGDLPSVRQVNGGINGDTFPGTVWGQTHSIVYLATDKDGLTDNCYFDFTVIVPSCAKLGIVQNGSYTCTNDTAPGSSCLFSCDEGFKLSGSGNITCGYTSMANQFPNWKNIQHCEKVKCASPATVDNADVTCSNNIYGYNTVCKVTCHQGFLLVGPQYTICQAKGEWSMQSLCTKERPGGTHCSPTLCNGHSCIQNHNDTYTCKCSHGWSGISCMNTPDYCSENICMNDATCSSHNDSYACKCDSGYSGYLCQNFPRNGHWSDWSFWSKCSVTCGSGVQTRHRACNNPPPDTYGKPCHGSHTVVKTCENKKCEVCPELKHTNDSLANLECETNQNVGLQTCTLTCKNGTIHTPWFKEFEILKCGSETNYAWVPGIVQAPCIVPVIPDELRLDTEVTYSTIIPAEHQPVVKDKVMENINETKCIQSSQCNATIKLLTTQVGADKKTKLDVNFRRQINVKNENAREEIESAISDLESTAEYIKNSTSKIFDVSTVDGTFVVENSSLRIMGGVNCSTGQVPLNGLCVECPVGTFKGGNLCIFCPKGSFQWQTGQTSCIRCPSGHTTYTVGSVYEVQCFVYEEEEEETTDGTDILSTGSNLAIILGPVVTLVVAIPTFVLFCYKMRDRRKKQEQKKRFQQLCQKMNQRPEEKGDVQMYQRPKEKGVALLNQRPEEKRDVLKYQRPKEKGVALQNQRPEEKRDVLKYQRPKEKGVALQNQRPEEKRDVLKQLKATRMDSNETLWETSIPRGDAHMAGMSRNRGRKISTSRASNAKKNQRPEEKGDVLKNQRAGEKVVVLKLKLEQMPTENILSLTVKMAECTDVRQIQNLPFGYVIPVNSPTGDTDLYKNDEELKNALKNVLHSAYGTQSPVGSQSRVKSVAMPSISSGDSHYPKDPKDKIAELILTYLLDHPKNIQGDQPCPLKTIYCVLNNDWRFEEFEKQFDIVYTSQLHTTVLADRVVFFWCRAVDEGGAGGATTYQTRCSTA